MSWDFDNNQGGNTKSAEFTKFPEGITEVRVLGNDAVPHERWTHWLPKQNKSVNCPGKGCPICEIRKNQKANKEPYSYSMQRRFALEVYNKNTERVEIMEQGITFFTDLREVRAMLAEEGKTFDDAYIKVRRRGTGKDNTSYRLDIGDTVELTNEEKKAIEEKMDLNEYFKPHTIEQITRLVNGEDWSEVMKDSFEPTEDEEKFDLA